MSATTTKDAARSNPQSVVSPLHEISAFVKQITQDAHFYMGNEKRSEARYSMTVPVRVCQISHSFERVGEEFVAVSRDISTRGISFFHTAAVSEKWLSVELTVPEVGTMQAVIEVLRCRAVGPLFEIAGRFVNDLNS